MKLIRKLVTGLMILLVALGSSPLKVFALPNNGLTEWPTGVEDGGDNDVTRTLPDPPAPRNIVDLKQMFNYPILDYSGLNGKPDPRWKETWRPGELEVIKSLKGYVPDDDSSVAVITRDAPWQAGVMWSKGLNKINLAEPFHMISYVYLGSRGQWEKIVDGNKRGGADGITFTIHNDKKNETILDDNERKVLAGNKDNHGMNAYGALGNGLGVYGSNFSANTASDNNNTADMRRGVTNGIALEFDTFYNHNNTTQHSDNDLWQFVGYEGSWNSNFGHIGINYLNEIQNNDANNDGKQFGYESGRVIKHNTMLAVGWDGEISKLPYEGGGIPGLHYQNGWQVSKQPSKPLADNMWHRLEVTWEPNTTTKTTGKLTYKIYRQGYTGKARTLTSIAPTEFDGNSTIDKDVYINVSEVFGVDNIYNSVYWGFTGSTGYYQNNQAVQMLQLPVNYYTAELSKVDQDRKPVSGARFQIEKKNETTGEWEVQKFYNLDPETPGDVDTLETGTQDQDMEIYDGVFQSLGKIKLTKLTYGKYRWTEISAPDGYEMKETYFPSREFDVNYQNRNRTATTTAVNKRLYQLELTKTDSDTQQAIDIDGVPIGVPFIFSKTENDKQYNLKVNAETNVFEWTEDKTVAKQFLTGKSYLLGQDGTVTEQDGVAGKIIVKYFPDAPNFSWEEVEVPKGYDSSGTLTGKFKPRTDNGYVYSAEQTNSRLFQVSLEKKASDTGLALAGAFFTGSLSTVVGR